MVLATVLLLGVRGGWAPGSQGGWGTMMRDGMGPGMMGQNHMMTAHSQMMEGADHAAMHAAMHGGETMPD